MSNIDLEIKLAAGSLRVSLKLGGSVFILGANGTGKSALIQRIYSEHGPKAKRISASRQLWLATNGADFSASVKIQTEQQLRSYDAGFESRFKEINPGWKSSLTLADVMEAQHSHENAVVSMLLSGDVDGAKRLANSGGPIAQINVLLSSANIPVIISVEAGDQFFATKYGSIKYGVNELSDGERNALLIAADVITAKPGTILMIDEPERHLHRSISSPLLNQLIRVRGDCYFVIATHDLELPVSVSDSQIIILRSCLFEGRSAISWVADLLPPTVNLDESLKQDIIGSRSRIIFVEGVSSSLDQQLYSLIFPDVSIIGKGSSRSVEAAVVGLRSVSDAHWVKAWGIIDNDGRTKIQIKALDNVDVFVLPYFSIESIFYHERIIKAVAQQYATISGGDGTKLAEEAISKASNSIIPHIRRLAIRVIEKSIRHQFALMQPTVAQIEASQQIALKLDFNVTVSDEIASLNAFASRTEWSSIVERIPVRETTAPGLIARAIGYQNSEAYENAVLQMLKNGIELDFVKSIFASLQSKIYCYE